MTISCVELDSEAQRLTNVLIDNLSDRPILSDTPFSQLTQWLDEERRMVDCTCDESNWIHAPEVSDFIEKVAELFDGPANESAVLAYLDKRIDLALRGSTDYWGEEYAVPIVAPLQHSDGRQAFIVYELIAYLSGPYRWHGLFLDRASVSIWLEKQGHILTLEQYYALPREKLLNEWAARDDAKVDRRVGE